MSSCVSAVAVAVYMIVDREMCLWMAFGDVVVLVCMACVFSVLGLLFIS